MAAAAGDYHPQTHVPNGNTNLNWAVPNVANPDYQQQQQSQPQQQPPQSMQTIERPPSVSGGNMNSYQQQQMRSQQSTGPPRGYFCFDELYFLNTKLSYFILLKLFVIQVIK